ncbi:hypothetical protein BC834DRAFT_844284 [Gloeopeniophorella convolvens]|nr:hypothetical protein BC834DRAFT_844284 [Gloeopeniophorella convolvens]
MVRKGAVSSDRGHGFPVIPSCASQFGFNAGSLRCCLFSFRCHSMPTTRTSAEHLWRCCKASPETGVKRHRSMTDAHLVRLANELLKMAYLLLLAESISNVLGHNQMRLLAANYTQSESASSDSDSVGEVMSVRHENVRLPLQHMVVSASQASLTVMIATMAREATGVVSGCASDVGADVVAGAERHYDDKGRIHAP